MNTRCFFLGILGVAAIVAAAGCDGSGPTTIPIRGEVLYNAAPLKEGTVTYVPKVAGQGRPASGGIQPDGSFTLTTFKASDGVMPGEYSIVVHAYQPRPAEPTTREEMEALGQEGEKQRKFIIPEKYTRAEDSGLSDTVNDDHSGFKRIELSD